MYRSLRDWYLHSINSTIDMLSFSFSVCILHTTEVSCIFAFVVFFFVRCLIIILVVLHFVWCTNCRSYVCSFFTKLSDSMYAAHPAYTDAVSHRESVTSLFLQFYTITSSLLYTSFFWLPLHSPNFLFLISNLTITSSTNQSEFYLKLFAYFGFAFEFQTHIRARLWSRIRTILWSYTN